MIKGKVKIAANKDEVKEGETLVSVTGGEGFYVQGMVNELNLANIQVGDTVHIMNYMNGMSYEGTILNISDVPTVTSNFSENPNESGYAFTVHIDAGAELNLGDYVEISYGAGGTPEEGGKIYIDKMYVREEDGESYMFIAVDGKLKKQVVKTGKTLYGWCIEIQEGLGMEDYVAFPYGKLAKNGTKVNMPEGENTGGGGETHDRLGFLGGREMLENIRLAFAGVWTHKLRSCLTMLGIIIGIASIIAISSTIMGTNEQIKQNLIGAGNNAVEIQLYQNDYPMDMDQGNIPMGVPEISQDTLQQVRELSEVEAAAKFYKRNIYSGIFHGQNSFSNGFLYGIDGSYLSVYGYQLQQGRGFTEADYDGSSKVVLLDKAAADALFLGANPVGAPLKSKVSLLRWWALWRKAANFGLSSIRWKITITT